MRISKIYSNFSEFFTPVIFSSGLNVIMGRIGNAPQEGKDSHNLGKSTLCQLIDFCLLRTFDEKLFLKKAREHFESFVFYLELQLPSGEYVTIRRGVNQASKISFKKHSSENQDYSALSSGWDHFDIPFDTAKDILDGYLDFEVQQKANFRNYLMYLMRGQDDYDNVLTPARLNNLTKSWQPILLNVLDLHGDILKRINSAEEKKGKIQQTADQYEALVKSLSDSEKIDLESDLRLALDNLFEKKEILKKYELSRSDSAKIDEFVNQLDVRISYLNKCIYQLKSRIKNLRDSLESRFNTAEYQDLFSFFEEINLLFKDGVKKTYNDLVQFNKQIYSERRKYIQDEIKELEYALTAYQEEQSALSKKKKSLLRITEGDDVEAKIEAVVDDIAAFSKQISDIEQRQKIIQKKKTTDIELQRAKEEEHSLKTKLQTAYGTAMQNEESILYRTRSVFERVIRNVLSRRAEFKLAVNHDGKIDCSVGFLDATGKSTQESDGNTYKKLLCIAFDMAVLEAHAHLRYPHFVFHDGIFEALDNALKGKLLAQVIESTQMGIQHIITMIESDLPPGVDIDMFLGGKGKVVLTLSDEDDNGLLFKGMHW